MRLGDRLGRICVQLLLEIAEQNIKYRYLRRSTIRLLGKGREEGNT
jgi:hypothetical protein